MKMSRAIRQRLPALPQLLLQVLDAELLTQTPLSPRWHSSMACRLTGLALKAVRHGVTPYTPDQRVFNHTDTAGKWIRGISGERETQRELGRDKGEK